MWNAASDIGIGIGTSGYVIEASLSPTFDSLLMSESLTNTGMTQTRLPSNTDYRRVYAFDVL